MRHLSGYRPVWMLLASLFIFSAVLGNRLFFGQTPLSAASEAALAGRAAATTAERIADYQDRLRLNPEDTAAYAQLGLVLLQRVRETGDASLYNQAETALNEAIERDPERFEALIGQGLLALARHDFTTALDWGERARQINAYSIKAYGVIADAQIELGRYEAAESTLQTMLTTRPELSVYSRLSYLRELRGDTAGAIAAMQRAVDSGLLGREETLWTQVQLGHLYFNSGDLATAERIYSQALTLNPDYAYAFAGIARVRAARREYDQAIEFYEAIVEVLPLPEFVIALGELYEVTGQPVAAQQQYNLVRAIARLNAQAGMNSDLEMALFEADHGLDPAQVVVQAKAAYHNRPTIYGADVLGWALYQNGDYEAAYQYSLEALRLGTQDALLHFHAGMIAHALGRGAKARHHWQQALDINPYFSVRYAPQVKQLLADME